MPSLAALLELTDEQARAEWGRILQREWRPRQEPYRTVELVLCCALFRVVDPHRFGGQNIHLIPGDVIRLADLFKRSSKSINIKMLNLDGSYANGAACDVPFFDQMAADPLHLAALYERVLLAARHMGIGPERLPDFLEDDIADGAMLIGQAGLPHRPLIEAAETLAAKLRARQLAADEGQTFRVAEQQIRLGQHRFAKEVLANYGHRCGFCDFAPRSLPRKGLLIASHIKPWAACDDSERLDASNGIAACPMHDTAFDAGLITVNGGLQVHRAHQLQQSRQTDQGVERNFGRTLRSRLRSPDGAAPRASYLRWHQEHIFLDTL
ncbi:HNH endonuclease [Candidatus Poriferisodalis sp.]|uniref:HNH endonuclease n=1 Tax=Candidatus Poriferisodalis sp. TaxID=3101277 RepID=UPI003B01A98B